MLNVFLGMAIETLVVTAVGFGVIFSICIYLFREPLKYIMSKNTVDVQK